MFTLGGATFGYCATGSVRIAAMPASMMTIDITHANTGRLAKNRASMSVPRSGSGSGGDRLDVVRVHRHPREDLVEPLDDQLVAILEAARDQPAIADRAIGDDR